jgi:nicotinate dehydrogenase subunit A
VTVATQGRRQAGAVRAIVALMTAATDPGDVEFTLTVNGQQRAVACGPNTPLLYVLRNDLALIGTRFGCGLGQCGACNVLIGDQVVHSCDTPMWSVGDQPVTTVEALGTLDEPGPLQRAFLAEQAGQCGFCLSGILMSVTALLRAKRDAAEPDVREALDGNLCRCGAHNRIIRAVLAAQAELVTSVEDGQEPDADPDAS